MFINGPKGTIENSVIFFCITACTSGQEKMLFSRVADCQNCISYKEEIAKNI